MKKSLTAVGLALVSVVGMASGAAAGKPVQAQMNQPSYWEAATPEADSCSKLDGIGDGTKTFTLPEAGLFTLVVLKAGSGDRANETFVAPVAGATFAHATGKDLSHVIVCVGDDVDPTDPTDPVDPTDPNLPEPPAAN